MARIEVGTVIRNFGWGYWGRDNYDDKRCIATGYYGEERYAVFHHPGAYHETFSVLSEHDLESIERLMEEENL